MNIVQELIEKRICFAVIKHYTKFLNVSNADFFATIIKTDIDVLFQNCDLSIDRAKELTSLISLFGKNKKLTTNESLELVKLKDELAINEYFNKNFNFNDKYDLYEYDMNDSDLAEFKRNLDLFKLVKENKEGRVYELKESSFKTLAV